MLRSSHFTFSMPPMSLQVSEQVLKNSLEFSLVFSIKVLYSVEGKQTLLAFMRGK